MAKKSGEVRGYKWEAESEKCLGGWTQTYYLVEAPDGEIFCDSFTSGPLQDGVDACMTAIADHENGEYE